MSTAPRPSGKFVRLAHLRRLRGCHQVAAVCYRVRSTGIEFLLVQTRGSGRWTFPKGSAEPGLTHAQAAALEAFEEAGVHGRMEEASFTSYVRRSRPPAIPSKAQTVMLISVRSRGWKRRRSRDRNPTWFSAEKAKRCLREDRGADYAAEFARVVNRAVARIERIPRRRHHGRGTRKGNDVGKDCRCRKCSLSTVHGSPWTQPKPQPTMGSPAVSS